MMVIIIIIVAHIIVPNRRWRISLQIGCVQIGFHKWQFVVRQPFEIMDFGGQRPRAENEILNKVKGRTRQRDAMWVSQEERQTITVKKDFQEQHNSQKTSS